jgi:DNA-binding MarR family transcriptional regulator
MKKTKVVAPPRWIDSVQKSAPLRHGFVGTEIRLAFHAMEKSFATRTASKLAPTHGTLLVLIDENPDLSQQQLSAAIGLQRSTVTRTIDHFERQGWVRRRARDGDRRSYAIRITRQGSLLARRLRPAIADLEDCMSQAFGARNRKVLIALLRATQRALWNYAYAP